MFIHQYSSIFPQYNSLNFSIIETISSFVIFMSGHKMFATIIPLSLSFKLNICSNALPSINLQRFFEFLIYGAFSIKLGMFVDYTTVIQESYIHFSFLNNPSFIGIKVIIYPDRLPNINCSSYLPISRSLFGAYLVSFPPEILMQ